MNDSEEEIEALSAWISSVDRSIPLHITRFFPRRRMSDRMPTDISLLKRLCSTAEKHLDDVLIGNV